MIGRSVNDEGYTLAEMLGALMIVGLAVGGMTGGAFTLGLLQRQGAIRAARAEQANVVSNGLDLLLRGQGPFSSAGGVKLEGDRGGFHFTCAGGGACSMVVETKAEVATLSFTAQGVTRTVALGAMPPPMLEYLGSKTAGDHWPPDNPTDWQRLRAIRLVEPGSHAPLVSARVWIEGASNGQAGS